MTPDATPIFGRTLVVLGILLAVAGLSLIFGPRLPSWMGRMPGDISFSRGNVRVYVPLGTCILLSLILTIVVSIVSWLRR